MIIEKLKKLNERDKLILILGIGVLIRLVFMPIAGHTDIISTYTRSYSISFSGESIFSFNQHISHWIQSINLLIYDIFFDKNNLTPLALTRNENSWVNFNLFFFKVPYLVFDIASLFVLKALVKNTKRPYQSLAFYFLNPLVIFAIYIFGRYESFPIFFMLLGLYLLKNNKLLFSMISFGILIMTRTSFLLFVPLIILGAGKNLKEKILTLIPLIPFGAITLYQSIFLNNNKTVNWVKDGGHTNYLLNFNFDLGSIMVIYPVIILLAILFYVAFHQWIKEKESYENLSGNFALLLIIIFSFGIFHPQYIAWLIPLLAINLMNDSFAKKHLLMTTLIIILAFPVMILTWGNAIFPNIFLPLSERIGNYDFVGTINNYYSYVKLGNLGKSIISAMLIILGYFHIKKFYIKK